jgi:hypothetical protein
MILIGLSNKSFYPENMVFATIAILCSIGIFTGIMKHFLGNHNATSENSLSLGSYTYTQPSAELSLIIEGNQLNFLSYAPSAQIVRTAVDFCSQHGEQFGFTLRSSGDCVDQIVEAIQTLQAAGSDISTWMLEFKRPKDGQPAPLILEAQQVQFTSDGQAHPNVPAIISKLPIQEEDLVQIVLEINGANFCFEVNRVLGDSPEANTARSTAAHRLAVDFCRLRAVEFGIISSEDSQILQEDVIPNDHVVYKKCIDPLFEALYVRLNSKSLAPPKGKQESPLIEPIREQDIKNMLDQL